MSHLPCSARIAATALALCGIAFIASHTNRPAPRMRIAVPPAEFVDIRDRYPIIRQIERDLASGRTRLGKAIELVEPLIEGPMRDGLCANMPGCDIKQAVGRMLVG